MTLSSTGSFFEYRIKNVTPARVDHRYKFVLSDGTWTLRDGLPTTVDENGHLNHIISTESSHTAYDTGLNPTAREFSPNPNAGVFVPQNQQTPQNQQVSLKHSNSRKSRSRSKASHSRNNSVASRHRSLSRTDELNPDAHEFKPQFGQPTNHVPHASGYAAALKKSSSPTASTEFKKPALPTQREQCKESTAPSTHATKSSENPPMSGKSQQHVTTESSLPIADPVDHGNAALTPQLSETRTEAGSHMKQGAQYSQMVDKSSTQTVSEEQSITPVPVLAATEIESAEDSRANFTPGLSPTKDSHISQGALGRAKSELQDKAQLSPLTSKADHEASEMAVDGKAIPVLQSINLSDEQYDAEQIKLMEEICIILDRDDKPIGEASKKDSHLMTNIDQGLLHRAFSLFVFNSEGKLLLQQRASEKITFPDMWTNTCCSHPLSIDGEVGSDLRGYISGVKKAAQRKVLQELGICASDAPIAKMHFLTRIHYLAPSDGKWGEHEIDYILFLQADPSLKINPNEIRDHRWVTSDELHAMFQSSELSYTPWFKLICETFLFEWWSNLHDLSVCEDISTIHRLGVEPSLFEKIKHTDSPMSNSNADEGTINKSAEKPIDEVAEPAAENSSYPIQEIHQPSQADQISVVETLRSTAAQSSSDATDSAEAAESDNRLVESGPDDTQEVFKTDKGKNLKPNPNFFAYIFRSLFGNLFRGCKQLSLFQFHTNRLVSSLWDKLAFWRSSLHSS